MQVEIREEAAHISLYETIRGAGGLPVAGLAGHAHAFWWD